MRIREKRIYTASKDAFVGYVDMNPELEDIGPSSVDEVLANSFVRFTVRSALEDSTCRVFFLPRRRPIKGLEIDRLVTDNHKVNVAAVDILCAGKASIQASHPADPSKEIFLSFDQSHIIKNVRSQFLPKDFGKEKQITSKSPLICTVSIKFTNVSSIPRDGVCDFIFYESFYLKNNPSGWTDSGLDHFLTLGQSMRITAVGASFSPAKDTLFADALSGDLNTAVDKLLSLGVSHFGMLSLYRRDYREDIQEEPAPTPPALIGIAEPSFYVALTHIPYADRRRSDCRILPMTMLNFPADPPRSKFKYGISIVSAASFLY
ncbi:hypothetical protein HPB49_022603 [Dermacentor silvarum]|uniref:Uncharacterized protein n=1 Tax=Dermacentor silvarum TaxID=543639 RepID=A0ACB8DR41_DERSI|nr:hypothetical protein HPB49_022603 [Dermacentor silvarum]